jgi:hypothetical protein
MAMAEGAVSVAGTGEDSYLASSTQSKRSHPVVNPHRGPRTARQERNRVPTAVPGSSDAEGASATGGGNIPPVLLPPPGLQVVPAGVGGASPDSKAVTKEDARGFSVCLVQRGCHQPSLRGRSELRASQRSSLWSFTPTMGVGVGGEIKG